MAENTNFPSCMSFHGVPGLRDKCVDAVNIAYQKGMLDTVGDLFAASDECDSHVDYEITAEEQFGFPTQLLRCVDVLCMNLEIRDTQRFLLYFFKAVPIGADLRLVWPKLALWMLQDRLYGIIHKDALEVDEHTLDQLYKMYHGWAEYGYIPPAEEWQQLSDHLAIQSPVEANELLGGLIKATGWVKPDDSDTGIDPVQWGVYEAFSAFAGIHAETIERQVDRNSSVASIGLDTGQTISQVQRFQLISLVQAEPVCSAQKIKAYQKHRKLDIKRAVNAA